MVWASLILCDCKRVVMLWTPNKVRLTPSFCSMATKGNNMIILSKTFQLFFISSDGYSKGRYLPTPDLGLPNSSEVVNGILIAIPLILIGFLILKSSNEKLGCLGSIMLIGGIICLLPLLAWIASIASSLLSIGVILVVVMAVICLIYNLINKKKE